MKLAGRKGGNRVSSSSKVRRLLIAATAGLAFAETARGQIPSPPGYYLIYYAAGLNGSEDGFMPPDGNLDNSLEWFEPVTGTPYESTPQSGDDAIVDNPGLGFVYGGLSCWGAGFTANAVPLDVAGSVSTGVGGLGLSGDPYGPSPLTLDAGASTSGPLNTGGNVNLNASISAGAWWDAGGNVGVNASASCNGLFVAGIVNVNSGGSVTAGQVGSIPPSYSATDFYSATTAFQVNNGLTANVNGGTLNCNGDAVIGADGDTTTTVGAVFVTSGTMITSGVTYMGVINPTEITTSTVNVGSGLVVVDGAGSTWQADGDIRAGEGANGSGDIDVQNGGTLVLGAGVNVRLGSGVDGAGSITFDGSTANPVLNSDSTSTITVGDQSFGALTVQNGASITHGGTIVAGNVSGSYGIVTIQGAKSSLTSTGDITVGSNGTGDVNVVSSATLTAAGNLMLGSGTTGYATVNVGQAASKSNSPSSGTVIVDKTLTIGEAGFADLEVLGGAVTVLGSGTNLVIGDGAAGNGTLDVNGASSNAAVTATGVIVGNNGQGTLTVENGGELIDHGDFTMAAQPGSSASVTIDGQGSSIDVSGNITVSEGVFTISDGAELGSGSGTLGGPLEGRVQAGPAGQIESLYTQGQGYLNLTSGSSAQVAILNISSTQTTSGQNMVSGSGTRLTIASGYQSGGLNIGSYAPGDMLIKNGATVQVNVDQYEEGQINIGSPYSGTLTINNATLNAPSVSMIVGQSSPGALILNTGAQVTAGSLTVSGPGSSVKANAGSSIALNISGQVNIEVGAKMLLGTGALLSTSSLTVGANSTLDCSGGGSVNVGTVIFSKGADSLNIGAGGAVKDLGSISAGLNLGLGAKLGGSGEINGKVISGGDVALADPQTLTINGDYEQTSTGELDVELDGADPGQYDQLNVTGNFTLDAGAVLDLNFANGFAPTTGEMFDIINDANLTSDDAFSQINVSGLEPGWEYSMTEQNGEEVVESLNDGLAVPEPSMLGVVVSCGAMGLRRRRRATQR